MLIRLLCLLLTVSLLLFFIAELLFALNRHFHLVCINCVLYTHLHQHATEVVQESRRVQMGEEVLAAGAVNGIGSRPLFDLKANDLFVFKFVGNKPCFFIGRDVNLIAPQREVSPRG